MISRVADLQNALEKAIYDRLVATITLASVGQEFKENTGPPLVIMGQISSEDIGTKDDPMDQYTVDIITEVKDKGRRGLTLLQRQVADALGRWKPAETADVIFDQLVPQGSNGVPEEDGKTYIGSQTFVVIVIDKD